MNPFLFGMFLNVTILPPTLSSAFLVKNCFRVSSRGRSKAHSYSLQDNDSFSKQQWVTCLRQAMVQSRDMKAQSRQSVAAPHPDPTLCHIADLSIGCDTDMTDVTSR